MKRHRPGPGPALQHRDTHTPEKLGRNLAREGDAQHPLPASKLHQLFSGGRLQCLLLDPLPSPPAPTQHHTQCRQCFINGSVNDFCGDPCKFLGQITSQHTWAGLKGWIAPALPYFFPSQSTGVPTERPHLPRGPAAPVPCSSLSQGTVTFSQHWLLGCSQRQSLDEPSPTIKHLLTLNVASKKTTWGLLCRRALLAGEEVVSKHAGEGKAALVSGLV